MRPGESNPGVDHQRATANTVAATSSTPIPRTGSLVLPGYFSPHPPTHPRSTRDANMGCLFSAVPLSFSTPGTERASAYGFSRPARGFTWFRETAM